MMLSLSLIMVMGLIMGAAAEEKLTMGHCQACLEECAPNQEEVLEFTPLVQEKGKIKFSNNHQILDKGCARRIYQDKEINKKSVKICCLKADIFKEGEYADKFKVKHDANTDTTTVSDEANGVEATVGKCVFCNSKIFYANCKRKRQECAKTFMNLELPETCPGNMVFGGRIALRKFFTLKDFMVAGAKSMPGDNYKVCGESMKKGQMMDANPDGTMRAQESRGYNMCCHPVKNKQPMCQLCTTCGKFQKSILTIQEDFKGILSQTSLFKMDECQEIKDKKDKPYTGKYLNFMQMPAKTQKKMNAAQLELNVCCQKIARGVQYKQK